MNRQCLRYFRSSLAVSALPVIVCALLGAGAPLLAQQNIRPRVLSSPGGASLTLLGEFGGSLIRSTDRGQTWTPVYLTDPGLPQPNVITVHSDLLGNSTFYARTTDPAAGLWKSTDDGVTWAIAMNGIPNSAATVDFFKQVREGPNVFLYLRKGQYFYKSTDRGNRWVEQGILPFSGGVMDVSDSLKSRMYAVKPGTFDIYTSITEGIAWAYAGTVVAGNPKNNQVNSIHVVPFNQNRVYVSVDGPGIDRGAYLSADTAVSFTTVSGLDVFSRMFTGASGPFYASLADSPGFIRSVDEILWNRLGTNPINSFSIHAVDQVDRLTLWGLRGGNLPQFVVSHDGGNSWNEVVATLTPTLSKPVRSVEVGLAQGAPYVHSFEVTAFENRAWQLPVTLSTSGESWLELETTTGITPLANAIRINTVGLAAGTYQSTITVNAPASVNKTVSFNVNLTVRPFGTVGPQYVISSFAGQGGSEETRTTGPALELKIGAPKALAIGPQGRLWISSGNRLWRTNGAMLDAVAGNGVNSSSGDGLGALSASIADPQAIAFDSQMAPHFTEYLPARVRRITNNALSTRVNFAAFNFTEGSHGLVIDPFGTLLMANSQGILRYNGNTLQVRTAFPFTDPWGMVQDASGNLFVSDRGANKIYKVTQDGVVTTIAGRGTAPGFAGDGGPASDARLSSPSGLALAADGTLYIADTGNQRIRMIAPGGTISTIAGSGLAGYFGDGYTAEFASFQDPVAVAVDADGKVYIGDTGNNRVRVLTLTANLPDPPPGTQPAPPVISAIARGGSVGDPLSPGGVFSLYGDLLAAARTVNDSVPWQSAIDEVSVTINGRTAPIYFVDPKQINGQIPFETELGTATVVVTFKGLASDPVTFQVVAASPGILLFGENRAVMVNQDGSVNQSSAPARPGEIGVLYLSGIGEPTVSIATGVASPASPLAEVNYPYSITVGGQTVEILFLGYTPGYPTLVQANIRIPSLPPGDHLIVVTVNGVASNAALITVTAP